jgi:hypothetical protein
VEFLKSEIAPFRDAVFTHNHPGGAGSFSPTDLKLASEVNFREIRAVDRQTAPDGTTRTYLYRAVRRGDKWPSPQTIETMWRLKGAGQVRALAREVAEGRMALEDGNRRLRDGIHERWAEAAEALGIDYERVALD